MSTLKLLLPPFRPSLSKPREGPDSALGRRALGRRMGVDPLDHLPRLQLGDRRGLFDPHRFALLVLIRLVMGRSEEHTSELQSLMRSSYAVFCLKKKNDYIRSTKLTETIK